MQTIRQLEMSIGRLKVEIVEKSRRTAEEEVKRRNDEFSAVVADCKAHEERIEKRGEENKRKEDLKVLTIDEELRNLTEGREWMERGRERERGRGRGRDKGSRRRRRTRDKEAEEEAGEVEEEEEEEDPEDDIPKDNFEKKYSRVFRV